MAEVQLNESHFQLYCLLELTGEIPSPCNKNWDSACRRQHNTAQSFRVPDWVKNKMLDDHRESPKKAINRLCVISLGITSQQEKLLYMLCWQQHMAIQPVAGIKQTFPSAARGFQSSALPPLAVPAQSPGLKHRALTRNTLLVSAVCTLNYGT